MGSKPVGYKIPCPAASSDAVAEVLLDCCAILMQRCPSQNGEQLTELLARFATVVSLSKATAAEEVCSSVLGPCVPCCCCAQAKLCRCKPCDTGY